MFLPVNSNDLQKRGWKQCDFVIISGDAYVDHPSFGAALIGRLLESEGYKVGIIPQPQNPEDYTKLGKPRLAWLISSGNMDSMVNRYTANRKLRSEDCYSPGGKPGMRPDRALIPYTSTAKSIYKGVPVILGGIEASLRRLAHYDYWSNKTRRSILIDSKADLLIYGMAERQLLEIGKRLDSGEEIKKMDDIPGTVIPIKPDEFNRNYIELPGFGMIKENKRQLGQSFLIQESENNPFNGKPLLQKSENRAIIQNPPAEPLSREELDKLYSLPFERNYHPMYKKEGGVPALKEVMFSITANRGCFGACSFCAIRFHQGEIVTSRSKKSIIDEAESFLKDKRFRGVIHDVGGPTANFRNPSCAKQAEKGGCKNRKCLFPDPCPNLNTDHSDYRTLLEKLRKIEGINHIFIRSGIRYDFLLQDKNLSFFEDLCRYHVSGQLKVAPEHASSDVLKQMGKPPVSVYNRFKKLFDKFNRKIGKKQYMIPYLIASHPGTTLKDGVQMAEFLRDSGFIPNQVQDFYPTPGTLSSVMYHTEVNPLTGNKVYVPKGDRERSILRALMQFKKRENWKLVREGLVKAGRKDLIGHGRNCLVPPNKKK